MRDLTQRRPHLWAFLLGSSLTAMPAVADDQATARRNEMKALIKPLRALQFVGDRPVPVNVSQEPILRWNDATRTNRDGSLWVVGTTGRPIAVLTLEFYPNHPLGEVWVHEFSSLATDRIEIHAGEGFVRASANPTIRTEGERFIWAPKSPAIRFHDIDDAPAPADSEAKRLRQVKECAARFTADEYLATTEQTYALRLSPHPIHRYHDREAGIAEGVVFQLAHETNPEVLLLIEAQASGPNSTQWRWAAAPLTAAALTLRLDRKPVWNLPAPTPATPRETYAGIIKVQRERKHATSSGSSAKP